MIKFEEYEGKLFRMLDKPVPLTPDAEMPCLVRLIQDDSPMGRLNKRNYDESLNKIECATGYNKMLKMPFNNMPFAIEKFEIIGIHVKEGSDKWALYQMMQGKKVRHKSYFMPNVHCAMNEKRQIAIFTTPSSMIDGGDVICHANDWLTSRQVDAMIDERTGWQIYKEPKPQYKAGDWIEFIDAGGRKSQGKYLSKAYDNAILIRDTTYNVRCVVPTAKIIRKLSPADMVIHIGCLSGTVEKSPFPKFEFILATEAGGCRILFDALDTQTRELVESLISAQKEEEE